FLGDARAGSVTPITIHRRVAATTSRSGSASLAPMTRRSLALLLALAGCNSGRVTPAGGPAPAAPAGGSGPVSTAPGPTSAPAPTPPTPGCPSPSVAGAKGGDSLGIRVIGHSQYARIEDPRRLVIQNPVTWTRVVSQAWAVGAE